MNFNFKTMAYLDSLQSVLIASEYKIVGFDWPKQHVCINKVDTYKKRNGKLAHVHHHFRQWYQIPKEMIKWHSVTKKGYNFHWVWADDPEYTYQVNERYITKGDARFIVENRHTLTKINF